MTLNDYQEKAMMTCMKSSDNFSYMFLNLVGEMGEFSSKVAKHIRKEKLKITHNELIPVPNISLSSEEENDLKHEAGDILWQLSGLCHVLSWDLEDIAQMNLDKLASRQQRGVINGEGDNR